MTISFQLGVLLLSSQHDTQKDPIKTQWEHTSFCGSPNNSVRVQVLSHSPLWPAPRLCSSPSAPRLVTQPLLHWATKCSPNTAGPLGPSLRVCAVIIPCIGKALSQIHTTALSPPFLVMPSLTTFLKPELPPLAHSSPYPFSTLLSL